ncbi:MAG: hypothetical protein B6I28_04410, partial [Fusobacteriia bacterium 4572_132]
MVKNKITIMLIFFTIVLIGNAENLGENIFLKSSDFYFTSKKVNIFELKNKELELAQKILNKYKNYKGLDLESLLYEREYAFAMNQSKIMMIVKLSTMSFMDSEFYNNSKFENDFLESINTYYVLGENQFIYAYNNGKLFLSNDITTFFETIKNQEKVINDDEIFYKLMNKYEAADENYKYYKNYIEPVLKNKYEIKNEAGYGFETEIKKFYYIGEKETEINLETINFADVIDKEVKVEVYSNIDKLRKMLNEEFSIIQMQMEEKIYDDLQKKVKVLVNVIAKEGNYMILYVENDAEQILQEIKNEYEKAFFYNEKINLGTEKIKRIKIPI